MADGESLSTDTTEGRILAAAVSVFGARGFHETTVSHIAREAGVATGTIYNYFHQKEDLLVEVFRRYIKRYHLRLSAALKGTSPGSESLRRFIEVHLAIFERDRALAQVFHVHWREVRPEIREGILPSLISYFEKVEKLIAEGQACGAFASTLDRRLARELVVGALDEVVTSWAQSSRTRSLATAAGPLTDMLSRALCA